MIPVGTSEYSLNSNYFGGALDTYGLDVGYAITPDFKATVGYYYQQGDLGSADSSGVLGRLSYNISNGLIAGVNLNGYGALSKNKTWQTPVIQALTETVKHRKVRVHDTTYTVGGAPEQGIFCG